MTLAARVWEGVGPAALAARWALAPAAALYGAAVRVRSALYDHRLLAVRPSPLPAVSIGNLTVGGTGKTPVAAWFVAALSSRGARPGLVLRGYGNDESRVHGVLNPGSVVVVDPDRARGIRRARLEGCDVAVLDDAFQHRRAARLEDVVLVSADRWWREGNPRLLPAGPYREPVSALQRATCVVVTRKAASPDSARRLASILRPEGGAVVAWLAPTDLHEVGGAGRRDITDLRGTRVLAVSGVGDPVSFAAQLTASGARVEEAVFGDHHAFDATEAARLAARAESFDLAVCTLKDAVKLGLLWPRQASALWYVSLRCEFESGGDAIEGVLGRLLAARTPSNQDAGA